MTRQPPLRRALGTAGEDHARRWLEGRGFRFVAHGWRAAGDELDLVMWDGDELAFIEVKTRHGEGAGRAADAVSGRQAVALLRAATAYIAAERTDGPEPVWRIDLVAITLDRSGRVSRLDHYENAITLDG